MIKTLVERTLCLPRNSTAPYCEDRLKHDRHLAKVDVEQRLLQQCLPRALRQAEFPASSCSHSGKLLSDINVPEVISLRVRIRQMRLGNPKNPLLDVFAARSHIAKLLPIIKPTASDYVIDSGKCPLRMIQMTMQQSLDYSSLYCRDLRTNSLTDLVI